MDNVISLKGDKYFVTNINEDAFRVSEGELFIYIVPVKNGAIGRRSFLYRAARGETVPALAVTDSEYISWRFCFVAVEAAEITVIEGGNTSVLKNRFAKKAGVEAYELEGFELGCVEKYKVNIVAEDSLIHKTKQEQIKTQSSTYEAIYSVFDKDDLGDQVNRGSDALYNAAALICGKYNIPIATFETIKENSGNEINIANIAHLSHFSYREIVLDENWYRSDSGPLIAFSDDGKAVACIPKGRNRYFAFDSDKGTKNQITAKYAKTLSPKALCLYRPLPEKSLTGKDLVKYAFKSISKTDVTWVAVLTLVSALVGLLLPILNQLLYDNYIPLGQGGLVIQMGIVIGSFMLGNIFFAVSKNILSFRTTSRITYDIQNAAYDRLFNLPENFFRKYDSADLAQRVMDIGTVVNSAATTILTTFLTSAFSIVYLIRMFGYSALLAITSLVMIILYAGFIMWVSFSVMKYQKRIIELNGQTASMLYQFLNGISKIRIAGVENRVLYEYVKPYAESRKLETKKALMSNIGGALSVVASSVFALILYILVIKNDMSISIGEFIAFTSAFGVFSASILDLVGGISGLSMLKPFYQRLLPIIETEPEISDAMELPGEITGELEINHLSFTYAEESPLVLNDISLHIRAGEYVGIVGPSGCGKSTLLKLLLGFEAPTNGKIFYDGKDIESLDKKQLRKKFGVVLQDGKLIAGSIYENITIAAPSANMEAVKDVVKAVCLDRDISDMPMGLHTVLSEDCGTISGGQQQRILIARAIIGKPNILFFDEATSALDNATQAEICQSLDSMPATRIVIAHRLSTIINCDRIIVLDQGRIIEQGSYAELMENRGLFYDLASRQIS